MNIKHRLVLSIAVTLGVSAVAALLRWHVPSHAATLPLSNSALLAGAVAQPSAPPASGAAGAAGRAPIAVNYKAAFAQAKSYDDFARAAWPAARAGNADAQFFLAKALKFCDQMYGAYFQRDGATLTLDEAVMLAAKWKASIELVQSIDERCRDLQGRDAGAFGTAADWLQRATDAGHAAAQATTAAEMLEQQRMRSFLQAGAAPTPANTAPLIGNGADPAQLLQAAVKSGDPEALFNIGWASALLNPGSDGNTTRLAWLLVACNRGYDCSATADWVRTTCSRCDTSSPVNLVRSAAGADWPAVQQRAQDISAKLDAGQWTDLGLGG